MLPDKDRAKEQLMSELVGLRQRVAELEILEAERKRVEEALGKSEEKYKNLVNNSNDIVCTADESGNWTFLSPSVARILGYEPAEMVSKSAFDFMLPEDIVSTREAHKSIVEKGKSVWEYENRYIHKCGRIVTIVWNVVALRDEWGNISGTQALGRDITERKRAEEQIAKLAKFPSENPNPVMRVAQNGTILYANQAALLLLNEWRCQIGNFLPGYYHKFVLEVLSSKSNKDIEVECGKQIFSLTFAPVTSRDEVTLYGLDITERKQAEEREKELEQELSLSRRLAAVGELAAGVAHEINSPLTGVLGFSERLLRRSTDEEIRLDLERIHNEAQRIVKVMDNLRAFTRRREPEKQYSDINDILQMALELRAYELKTGNIEVVTDLASGLPEIEVDFHQIQEVFLSIILNAEQAMTEAHGRGKLTIKTQRIKNNVRISFTDDGPGISAEHLDKVFDPFFTTRGEKGGTGLGLSVCHSIVAQHGGRLYARSKPGEGATFFVELPCS